MISSATVDATSLAQSVYIPSGAGIEGLSPTGGLTQTSGSGLTNTEGVANASSSNRFSTRSQAHSDSLSEAEVFGTATAEAQTETAGTSVGSSETLEPILEVLPSATYSLEEQAHVFAVGLMQQPTRHATVRLPGQTPRQITSLPMPDPIVGEAKLQRTITAMKEASPFLVPRAIAQQQIKDREAIFDGNVVEFVPTAETAFFDIKEES